MDRKTFQEGMVKIGVLLGIDWSNGQLVLYYDLLNGIPNDYWVTGVKKVLTTWTRRQGIPTAADLAEACVPGKRFEPVVDIGTGRERVVERTRDVRLQAIADEEARKACKALPPPEEPPASPEKVKAFMSDLYRKLERAGHAGRIEE